MKCLLSSTAVLVVTGVLMFFVIVETKGYTLEEYVVPSSTLYLFSHIASFHLESVNNSMAKNWEQWNTLNLSLWSTSAAKACTKNLSILQPRTKRNLWDRRIKVW